MKLAHPQLDHVLDFNSGYVNTLVIEQPDFFRQFLQDIDSQMRGCSGRAVLSEEDSPIEFARHAELIDSFLNFQLARKPLMTRLVSRLGTLAMDAENYIRTSRLLGALEQYIMDLSMDLPCSVYCSKMNFDGILRAVGIEILDDHSHDLERLLDYMELTRELEHDRLFILVNLRSYYSDAEMEAFFASVCAHEYHILPVDSVSRARLSNERRVTVDDDLCEF